MRNHNITRREMIAGCAAVGAAASGLVPLAIEGAAIASRPQSPIPIRNLESLPARAAAATTEFAIELCKPFLARHADQIKLSVEVWNRKRADANPWWLVVHCGTVAGSFELTNSAEAFRLIPMHRLHLAEVLLYGRVPRECNREELPPRELAKVRNYLAECEQSIA